MAGTAGAPDVGLDRTASWSLLAGNEIGVRYLNWLAGARIRIKVSASRRKVDSGT